MLFKWIQLKSCHGKACCLLFWSKLGQNEEQTGVTDAHAENGTQEHPPGRGGKVGPSSLSANSGPDSMMMMALGAWWTRLACILSQQNHCLSCDPSSQYG